MKTNTQKTIYLGAAAFLLSAISSFLISTGIAALALVAMFVTSCACAGAFALTVLVSPSKLYIAIVPAAALCAGFINMNVSSAIISLVPFAAGAVISAAAKRRSSKTGAVVACDAAVGAVMLAAFAAAYYTSYGTLAATEVVNSIREFFDNIESELVAAFEKIGLYDIYSRVYDMSSYERGAFYGDLAKEVVFKMKAISPAIMITLLNAFSYISTAFFALSCRISKTDIAIPNGKWHIMPSAVSSGIYIGSVAVYFLLALFNFSNSTVIETIYYAAANLVIILIPPMFICGAKGIGARFRVPRARSSAIMIIAVAAMSAIYNLLYGFAFVALIGAGSLMAYYRAKRINEKKQ